MKIDKSWLGSRSLARHDQLCSFGPAVHVHWPDNVAIREGLGSRGPLPFSFVCATFGVHVGLRLEAIAWLCRLGFP